MIQGKIIYNFGIPERLRTLRYSIFTGGVVEENGSCRACFLRKQSRSGGYPFRQSLRLCHLPQGDGFCAGAAKFTAKAQSLRACLLPLGGAVAQRLRGYGWRSEKSVKAIAQTGAALAFCASTSSLGLSRASSPWPVAGWVESRGREGGVGTPLPASGPAERPCTLKASRKLPRKAHTFPVLFWCQKRTPLGSFHFHGRIYLLFFRFHCSRRTHARRAR